MRLTSKNLVIGIDGSKWIYTDRKKSTQPVRIPLLPKAEVMITKFRKDPRAVYSGTLFPTISNQRLNSYLKELASLASIDSKITFHVARHTAEPRILDYLAKYYAPKETGRRKNIDVEDIKWYVLNINE